MTATLEKPIQTDKPLELKDSFTSTGVKAFHHLSTMKHLQNGIGRPVVAHLLPTDICQDSCSFCSVLTREGTIAPFDDMMGFLDILLRYGLKAVIISGGGNPLLYKCPVTKKGISELIDAVTDRGLECGMICNGMKLREYEGGRISYATLKPESLDRLLWLRVSMSGIDHPRGVVEIPDIDHSKTKLGLSWVMHDTYLCPTEPNHGKVSTLADLRFYGGDVTQKPIRGKDRLPVVTEQIREYVQKYKPAYVRLLPNCIERAQILPRCKDLQVMADAIDPNICFVQYKKPQPPRACLLGFVHPVMNSDGKIFACDSVVLQDKAKHKFDTGWSLCNWQDVAQLYENPVKSLIENPAKKCPQCVFSQSNNLLTGVWEGSIDPTPTGPVPEHVNFL